MKRLAVLASIGLCTVALTPACGREERRFEEPAYFSGGVLGTRIDEAAKVGTPTHGPGPYDGNAWAMGEGYRLFNQMNCVGCHANGGGAMGPPLIDGKWIYGSEAAEIFETIAEGRENGMPSYRGRMSDQQVWQLVAYVRSISGLAPSDAAPSRPDAMDVAPPNNRMKPQQLEKEGSH